MSEIDNLVGEKEDEINLEIEAFFAAILLSVGALATNKDVGLNTIRQKISSDTNSLKIKVDNIIGSMVNLAKPSLTKIRKIDKNAMIDDKLKASISDFITATKLEFNSLIDVKEAELTNLVFQQIKAGASKEQMIASVKKSLESAGMGNQSTRGLKTLIVTKSHELESFITKTLSEQAGVEQWKYVGPRDSKNRSWCASHVNKTLTKKEIEAWEGQSWTGKKSGDPFVVRGGWNCRHNFEPIK